MPRAPNIWQVTLAALLMQPKAKGTTRQTSRKPTADMMLVIEVMEAGKRYTASQLSELTGVPITHLKNRLTRMRERGLVLHAEGRGRFVYWIPDEDVNG